MSSDNGARQPVTTLHAGFSNHDAVATAWANGRSVLENAEVYWVTSVRPDGRPHVTPLLGIWLDGAMYFCTGDSERKAKNLESNPHCILTTGCNNLHGLDVVVEGKVAKVSDTTELRSAADAYESKYGSHFTSPDGTWSGLGDLIRQSQVVLYRLAPARSPGIRQGRPVQSDSVGVLLSGCHVSVNTASGTAALFPPGVWTMRYRRRATARIDQPPKPWNVSEVNDIDAGARSPG